MTLLDRELDFLKRQWEEKNWEMEWIQLHTLLDVTVRKAEEEGISDPSTAVMQKFAELDPTLTYDEAQEELYGELHLPMPEEEVSRVAMLEAEMDQVQAERDALRNLLEETPKAKRIREMEAELESREAKIERLEERMEGLRRSAREAEKKTGVVPESIRQDMEDLREEVRGVGEALQDFKRDVRDVITGMAERIEERMGPAPGATVEPEPTEEVPDYLENVAGRHPDIRRLDMDWDHYLTYMERVQDMDLPDIVDLNDTAAPVPPTLPPKERAVQAREAERAAAELLGTIQGYIHWLRTGAMLPREEPRTPQRIEIRREVMDAVEDQRPDVNPSSAWRAALSRWREKIVREETWERDYPKWEAVEDVPPGKVRIAEPKEKALPKVQKYLDTNFDVEVDLSHFYK